MELFTSPCALQNRPPFFSASASRALTPWPKKCQVPGSRPLALESLATEGRLMIETMRSTRDLSKAALGSNRAVSRAEALLLFSEFGATWTSVVLEMIGDSLTHGKPLTSKARGLHAPTLKAVDKNLRRVDRESTLAYMRPSLAVKAPSLVKGAPPRARARAPTRLPPTHARARDYSSSGLPPSLPPSAGARAAAQPVMTAPVVAQPVVAPVVAAPVAAPVAATMGGHGGPADGGARLRSFRRDFPFLDFGFCFLC